MFLRQTNQGARDRALPTSGRSLMFLTATEARTKWCPFVRIEGSNRFDNTLNDGFVNTPSVIRINDVNYSLSVLVIVAP